MLDKSSKESSRTTVAQELLWTVVLDVGLHVLRHHVKKPDTKELLIARATLHLLVFSELFCCYHASFQAQKALQVTSSR